MEYCYSRGLAALRYMSNNNPLYKYGKCKCSGRFSSYFSLIFHMLRSLKIIPPELRDNHGRLGVGHAPPWLTIISYQRRAG